MNNLMAIVILIATGANALHWGRRATGCFIFYPASGWLRTVFYVWCVATTFTALMFALRLIPGSWFIAVGAGQAIATHAYSIWMRQAQPPSRLGT
jgi:hypothetical protein